MSDKLIRRFRNKVFLYKKHISQLLETQNSETKSILLINGCQRSGTSLLSEILDFDLRTKVFGEVSKLSSPKDSKRLRLLPYQEVNQIIDKQIAPIVILKPLVESQNITEMLIYFKESKAVWMYRDFRDVVSSNLLKFGKDTGIRDLRPIVNRDDKNWRSEKISDETREVVKEYFSEDMSHEDAAALFWYVRNRIFFEQNIVDNPRVMICQYDNLVQNSALVVKNIYKLIGVEFPKEDILATIHSSSVKKGKNIRLTPGVEQICEELYSRLNDIYFENNKRKD